MDKKYNLLGCRTMYLPVGTFCSLFHSSCDWCDNGYIFRKLETKAEIKEEDDEGKTNTIILLWIKM